MERLASGRSKKFRCFRCLQFPLVRSASRPEFTVRQIGDDEREFAAQKERNAADAPFHVIRMCTKNNYIDRQNGSLRWQDFHYGPRAL